MKDKLMKELEAEARLNELKEKAKKIPRKQLEKLYVDRGDFLRKQREKNSGWEITAFFVILISILLILGIIMTATTYDGSETENYELLGQELCRNKDLGRYKYSLTMYDYFKVKCEFDDIVLRRG